MGEGGRARPGGTRGQGHLHRWHGSHREHAAGAVVGSGRRRVRRRGAHVSLVRPGRRRTLQLWRAACRVSGVVADRRALIVGGEPDRAGPRDAPRSLLVAPPAGDARSRPAPPVPGPTRSVPRRRTRHVRGDRRGHRQPGHHRLVEGAALLRDPRFASWHRVFFLHLVRDPRAVAHSWQPDQGPWRVRAGSRHASPGRRLVCDVLLGLEPGRRSDLASPTRSLPPSSVRGPDR